MYVTVKMARESGESNVQTPLAHQGGSFRSPRKKNKTASPDKDSVLYTLTLLKMDLVKFGSSVWNLKLAMATSSNLDRLNAPNNIAVYVLWGDEDSNWVDLCATVGEELLSINIPYLN